MTATEPARRKSSVSKPSLGDIPEASTPKMPSILSPQAPDGSNGSRRSSKDANSRRSSVGISFNATVKVLRASQAAVRKTSWRAKPSPVLPEPSGEAEALDSVPLPKSPRFTSTMSVEAQYTILKCYEDRLWRLLADNYPDYTELLHRSHAPSNGYVALKGRNDSGSGGVDTDEEGEPDSGGEENFRTRSALSLPANLFGHPSSSRPQMPQSARQDRRPNARIPHHKQLALSRRLQMAHKLLDTVTERPTGPAFAEKFNPIQGYNLWANSWHEEFDVTEDFKLREEENHLS